jgi:hypothetical protein
MLGGVQFRSEKMVNMVMYNKLKYFGKKLLRIAMGR